MNHTFWALWLIQPLRSINLSYTIVVLDTIAVIQKDLTVCSRRSRQCDHSYVKLVNASLSAWHKFIPDYKEFLPSNCWNVYNFNPISQNFKKELSSWSTLYHIEQMYSLQKATKIIKALVGDDQRALFTPSSNKQDTFCMPKVYLGGFPKCGTTSLYNLLILHPNIEQPVTKEGHFWREFILAPNQTYRDLEVLLYLYHFYHASSRIKLSSQQYPKITIDASASTVFASAKRWMDVDMDMCTLPLLLSMVLPDTKFVFIVRNPTERLWSDYWYFCSRSMWKDTKGRVVVPDSVMETSSELFHNLSVSAINEFHDCVRRGLSKFECTMRAYSDTGEVYACKQTRLGISLYYYHIVKWLSFFSREQFMIVRMEDLSSDPYAVTSSVWKFLELNPISRDHFNTNVRSNANSWIVSEENKNNFKMWPETRQMLDDFFAPYNELLAVMLGDDKFLWK